MKISRTKLLTLVEREIARRHHDELKSYQRRNSEYLRAREVYRRETEEAWHEFARRLQRILDADEPVTHADIPERLRSSRRSQHAIVHVWDEQPPTERPAQVGELERLSEVLLLSDDDEVSTHALEKQGFRLGSILTEGC